MEHHGFGVESWADLAHITKMFITFMGGRRLDSLQPEHFKAYESARQRGALGKKKAKSTGTLHRELTHLITAINFCVKVKLLNPAHVPFIPMPPRAAPRDRWLTEKEIAALKEAAVPYSRGETFLKIVLAQPYRRRTIETLEWSQLNFSTGMISPMKPGEVATSKRKPTLPMTAEQMHYLQELRHRRPNDKYVLEHTGGISDALAAIANRAKVPGVTPHVMRHTWATHASMNGVPMTEIARVLGDSVVTVEKIYAKYRPDYLRGAIEQAAL